MVAVTTVYDLLRRRCGLSQTEAAAFHRVRVDTIKSWCAGRNNAAPGALDELRTLYRHIERAAREAVAQIESGRISIPIELRVARDDAEAQSWGWPCIGAQTAVLGLLVAQSRAAVTLTQGGAMIVNPVAIEQMSRAG